MAARFIVFASPGERVAACLIPCPDSLHFVGLPVFGLRVAAVTGSSSRIMARMLGAFAVAATSAGCMLTSDIPNPALDIPPAYQEAGTRQPNAATPALDWWRGFRSRELSQLMEEAQTVNLDIAAAVARLRQADAQ